jgi:hypothetical protein
VSAMVHSRPGRASRKSGQVRYAPESESKFRALAAPLRHRQQDQSWDVLGDVLARVATDADVVWLRGAPLCDDGEEVKSV